MTFKHLKDNNLGDSINLAPELRECSIERSGAQQETLWLVPRPAAVVPAQRLRSFRTGKEFAGADPFYPDRQGNRFAELDTPIPRCRCQSQPT